MLDDYCMDSDDTVMVDYYCMECSDDAVMLDYYCMEGSDDADMLD